MMLKHQVEETEWENTSKTRKKTDSREKAKGWRINKLWFEKKGWENMSVLRLPFISDTFSKKTSLNCGYKVSEVERFFCNSFYASRGLFHKMCSYKALVPTLNFNFLTSVVLILELNAPVSNLFFKKRTNVAYWFWVAV